MRRSLVPVAMMLLLTAPACAEPGGPDGTGAAPDATAEGVVPLAKAAGWRPELGGAGDPFGLLEVAFDRETAERAWRENVPDNLAPGEGVPDQPGRYGDLDEVDFDRQALVVWSSGESGSCPAWLADVQTAEDGTVEIEVMDTARLREETDGTPVACTMDYRPYRMVLAVDRDQLPDPGSLPAEIADVLDVQVTAYPARQ